MFSWRRRSADAALAVVVAVLGLPLVAVGFGLAKMLLANQLLQRRLSDAEDNGHNWRRMAAQATIVLENRVNNEREDRGEPPFPVMADVKPEHNSPVTEAQREQARFASWRARVTRAALELGEEVPDVRFPPHRLES